MLAGIQPHFPCMTTLSRRISLRVYSQAWIRRVCQRGTRTVDSNRNTTNQITHSDRQSRPEQRKPRIIVRARVQRITLHTVEFRAEDNGHDDTVDSDDFAEDNRDQVLCANTWCFDSASQD